MALLPGSLYTKKSYGRSLFGDLKQAAEVATEAAAEKVESGKKKGTEADPEVGEAPVSPDPPNPTPEEEKMNAPPEQSTINNAAAAEVKVTWKKTSTTKNKRPPKEFFTPREETDPEAEHDKEVINVVDSIDKKPKKRLPISSQPSTLRGVRSSIPKPGTGRAASKPIPKVAKEITEAKGDGKQTDAGKESNVDAETVESKIDKDEGESSDVDTSYDDMTDNEEPTRTTLETVFEEGTEDMSDDSSSENKSVVAEKKEKADSKKPIVIKVVKSTKYAEKLRALLAEEGQAPSLEVLQPDAIASLKRELARKGIIESYDDDDLLDQPIPEDTETTESEPTKETSEPSVEVTEDELQETTNEEIMQDDGGLKDDKRDGYKTNKSFEIRRLQAKAEREREEKSMFSRPKFLKGSKVSTFGTSKGHDIYPENYNDHRKNWVRKKPKSILKMHDTDGEMKGRSKNKKNKRKSATVRIREPEYDYRLFSASESDDSSASVFSQSSSVLGYRPNSVASLSLSDSTISFMDDESFDSVHYSKTMQDLGDDENAFYRSSSLGRTVHDIYDDIDRLNPSRLTNVRTPHDVRERPFSARVASADLSYVDRSSLHALKESEVKPVRNTSAVRAYEDKPLQLFDAMRYENERKRSQGKGRKSSPPKLHPDDKAAPSPGQLRVDTGRRMRKPRRPSSKLTRNGSATFGEGAIAFGANMVPIPGHQKPGEISETEWVDRAQKFFATAYAGRRKQVEQRKSLKKPGIVGKFFRKLKSKKKKNLKKTQRTEEEREEEVTLIMPAICYCQSCPNCCAFACSTESTWSSIVIIFLPTMVIMACLLLTIFWVVGIFPV